MASLESFDPQFENVRLQQLMDQYPVIYEVSGDISFVIDEDGRLGKASWMFGESELDRLWASGIKEPLMELLDILIIYRRQHGYEALLEAQLALDRGEWCLSWT